MSKVEATNGDSVQVKLGGDFIRKTWPFLLAGGLGLGGFSLSGTLDKYEAKMKVIEDRQVEAEKKHERMDAKLDLVIELLKEQRRTANRREYGRAN